MRTSGTDRLALWANRKTLAMAGTVAPPAVVRRQARQSQTVDSIITIRITRKAGSDIAGR